MGNVNALSAQNQLNEIARMAYGSGTFFEGTSGGKGNIGLITGADGRQRVVKFNTHSRERGGVVTADQIKSANALRAQLLSIAKTLNPGVVAELRAKLGLGAGEDVSAGQSLLTRKIVAAAVKLINANGMRTAMEGVNAESLKSTGGTKFEEASVYATYGVSAKTLKACNMSTADFTESVNAVAEKFHLSGAQKQAVGRATASYLAALAEEGKTGQLDEEGNPKEGLPSKDELKRQISEGSFGGTYWGLAHVRAFSTQIPPFDADDGFFDTQTLGLSSSLSDDECADAAYFIAKMGTGKRGKEGFDNRLSPLAVKTLVDHRTELMALHQRNGTLSINDMWNVLVGRDAPKNIQKGSATDFSKAVGQKLLDKITQDHPEEARRRWRGNYSRFDDSLVNMMPPVIDFGVSVDVAVKLYFGEDVGDVQCSHTASAYDVTGDEYKRANEQKLASVISGDINRIEGKCSIKVGAGAYTLDIPKMAGNDFANEHTPELMKAMNRLIGGGDEIGNPVPNQLKTMCYMCNQAGNIFLTLAGLAYNQLDHWPVDKSFTLQGDSVLYTASGEVNGVKHTVQYQIEKDGTSHLVDYSRAESPATVALMQPIREVATPRLDKLADFVRTNGTEAEKANVANYKDAIVTAKNVRVLKDKVGKALANRPASVAQNVTANLMAFFAEINFRQAAKGVPLDSFETLLSRYAGNDEQIRLLDFSLSADQLKTMPDKLKNWLVSGFANRMGQKHFHDKTNVHVLSLREFNYVNVTINGEQPPELKSAVPVKDAVVENKEIKDGDKTITTADLSSIGGTGDQGADTLGRLAFHELLITKFPDPKVRAFVSYLISMSEGARGCYSNMFDMPGPDNVTGTEIPQFMQFMMQMHGVNAQPKPINTDVEAKGIYAITIEPDEIGQNGEVVKKGKIKVVVSSAEGMAIEGPDVLGLKFSAQPNEKLEFGLARQAYETTITIDPNEIGENGIPSFTVDEPVLK